MGGSEGEHRSAQQRINAVVQDGKASAAPTLGGFRGGVPWWVFDCASSVIGVLRLLTVLIGVKRQRVVIFRSPVSQPF